MFVGCSSHRGRPAAAATPSGTTWLIFVDDLHLDFRNTGYIRKLLHALATDLIVEGDVFTARSTGPSSLSLELTSDRLNLEAAIGRVAGSGLQESEVLASQTRREGLREIDYRFRVSVSAAVEMLNELPRWPERNRAMLYISNGYHVERARKRVAEIARVARRHNVIVFAMDPRAVPGVPVGQVAEIAGRGDGPPARDSLEGIAAGTGGFVVVEDLQVERVIARINTTLRR
jgi:hypothetical protein